MIDVLHLSYNPDTPSSGYWDMGILDEIFSNTFAMVSKSYTYNTKDVSSVPKNLDFAVIILPARSQLDYVDKLNKEIKSLKSVLLFIVGDEEGLFPVDKVKHDNIIIYVMSNMKHVDWENIKPFINGYPPQIKEQPTNKQNRDLNFFFSGQLTHKRRAMFCAALSLRDDGVLNPTKGFTQGLPHPEYYSYMNRAITAPAPSGPATLDTFRLYEALESGAVPIADSMLPDKEPDFEYWLTMFREEPPFPIITDDIQINGYINDVVEAYPTVNNKVLAWWINYKRELTNQIIEDIHKLSNIPYDNIQNITALIPTSPVKSNPSTKMIEETIKSIRHHLPNCEIMIMFDGVREEQENMRTNYDAFINNVLHMANKEYQGIVPVLFDEHSHQVKMTRETLGLVETSQILYVEQDTPLCTDVGIEFDKLSEHIEAGDSNMVRFHFEAKVPKAHEHMMHGKEKKYDYLLRTSQWSQRPHLASKYFYVQILRNHFSENAICFIEDKMHGVLDNAYREAGTYGWNQFKVHIYIPDENNIKRSYNLDGREGGEKYDEKQVF